jgi:hypothetical protein
VPSKPPQKIEKLYKKIKNTMNYTYNTKTDSKLALKETSVLAKFFAALKAFAIEPEFKYQDVLNKLELPQRHHVNYFVTYLLENKLSFTKDNKDLTVLEACTIVGFTYKPPAPSTPSFQKSNKPSLEKRVQELELLVQQLQLSLKKE